ncbi:hypothetical protein [Lacrimispora celerecrescens]|uniref:hypothetical protein n=1 Tax=Lacrimispora celerecrescens TaxID=29354 RepID=UPI0016467E77|nr:hypothetical protein [Lacrimispora celerecrescens]
MTEFIEEDLLTNFPDQQLGLYRKVVKEYGDTTIYISDEAYDIKGNTLQEYYSLRTKVNCNRSDFWQLFNILRKY